MPDKICGKVIRVVDGDTFDIKVTHASRKNEYDYNPTERIRIAGVDAPELNSLGKLSKRSLEKTIGGKNICITIRARDRYRRLVADVCLLYPSYTQS